MILLSSPFRALQQHFDRLIHGFGRVTRRSGEPRVEISDRHHPRGHDIILQMVRELREFIDVRIHATHETFQLRENFRHVGRYFGQGTGQGVEIIVAIHLQIAELGQVVEDGRWL